MNEKGFGLPELLVFIGVSLFALISITVYCSNKFKSDLIVTNYNEISDPIIRPNKIEIPSEYIKLEQTIEKASYNINHHNKNTIITVKELIEKRLINKIKDPNNLEVICNGYVVYKDNVHKYYPYINCPGMYITKDYNINFE